MHLARFNTPLGPLLAAAHGDRICLLTFDEVEDPGRVPADLGRRFGVPVARSKHPLFERLAAELAEYFRGERRDFTVPLEMAGTGFQRRVWGELQRIPYGKTASYQAVAAAVGNAAAVRAVGRANATNPICLLVPCHRVIAKDGTLGGYGGGLWRKQCLLELEQRGRLPATCSPSTQGFPVARRGGGP